MSLRRTSQTFRPRIDTASAISATGSTNSAGRIFCLVDAPDAEAAIRVHREAHGLVADSIHPVVEGD